MIIVKKIWENIKIQPDIWFFLGFLFTFTLSIRKVILYFPIKGAFNEYTGIYVYISDIFLFLTIILWLYIILYNNHIKLSMYRLWINHLSHKLSTLSRVITLNYYLLLPFILVAWTFLSILWANNSIITFFRSIKFLEFYILYIYIIFRIVPRETKIEQNYFKPTLLSQNVPRGTFCDSMEWNIFILIMILIASIQAIIGIIQVIIQHSIGLFWLKESLISPNIAGVAKIVINGQKYIRAYGLFPHSNILGGFLLLSIILTLLYLKLFHACLPARQVEHNISSPCQGEDAPALAVADEVRIVPRPPRGMFHVEHSLRNGTILIYLALGIQLLALMLTASKSAIIGLIIALLYIYILRLPRGMFHVEHSLRNGTILARWNNSRLRILILSILIVILMILIASPDLRENLNQSIQERLTFLDVSRGIILANPIFGVGMGQFVTTMQKYASFNLLDWQFQPVHNVFLLIWSELGIIGLILFIYFIYIMFHVEQSKTKIVPRGTIKDMEQANNTTTLDIILSNDYVNLSSYYALHYFKAILLGFLFIMLFDHYFWDIQQGSFMLWMVLGIIVGLKISCYNSKTWIQK